MTQDHTMELLAEEGNVEAFLLYGLQEFTHEDVEAQHRALQLDQFPTQALDTLVKSDPDLLDILVDSATDLFASDIQAAHPDFHKRCENQKLVAMHLPNTTKDRDVEYARHQIYKYLGISYQWTQAKDGKHTVCGRLTVKSSSWTFFAISLKFAFFLREYWTRTKKDPAKYTVISSLLRTGTVHRAWICPIKTDFVKTGQWGTLKVRSSTPVGDGYYVQPIFMQTYSDRDLLTVDDTEYSKYKTAAAIYSMLLDLFLVGVYKRIYNSSQANSAESLLEVLGDGKKAYPSAAAIYAGRVFHLSNRIKNVHALPPPFVDLFDDAYAKMKPLLDGFKTFCVNHKELIGNLFYDMYQDLTINGKLNHLRDFSVLQQKVKYDPSVADFGSLLVSRHQDRDAVDEVHRARQKLSQDVKSGLGSKKVFEALAVPFYHAFLSDQAEIAGFKVCNEYPGLSRKRQKKEQAVINANIGTGQDAKQSY